MGKHGSCVYSVARLQQLWAAGSTHVEIAARLDRPQSFVSSVERGERRVDVLEFHQIAETLRHDPARLLREPPLMARAHCGVSLSRGRRHLVRSAPRAVLQAQPAEARPALGAVANR